MSSGNILGQQQNISLIILLFDIDFVPLGNSESNVDSLATDETDNDNDFMSLD